MLEPIPLLFINFKKKTTEIYSKKWKLLNDKIGTMLLVHIFRRHREALKSLMWTLQSTNESKHYLLAATIKCKKSLQ